MRRLWLFFFPFLFLPNLGFAESTAFGVLEMSDWLIVPFILLLMLAPSARYGQNVSRLNMILWSFFGWALLSTASIHFRYDYRNDIPILLVCGLKLARLTLYVLAGALIVRKLADSTVRRAWLWSLLGALLILSIGLLAKLGDADSSTTETLEGYKSYNAIIVSVAILCSYVGGLWIDNAGSRRWNRSANIAVVFAVCSVLLSSSLTNHGRGGWVGFTAGFGYILFKRVHAVKTVAIIGICVVVSLTAYATLPTFRSLVDLTLAPNQDSAGSVDDGARLSTWGHEAPKLINSPILGTGFYHRGANSGLWVTGAHNFFIQMFLETGVIGGSLIVLAFASMWIHAGSRFGRQLRISTATRSALIAAIVGGMSETYFYGNIAVLALFAVIAATESLPRLEVAGFSFRRQRLDGAERVAS
jgi:hypothetical protein